MNPGPQFPTIPMRPEHQKLILAKRKTTTLRAESFTGTYRMEGRAESLGLVKLRDTGKVIYWNRLSPLDKVKLAKSEGYESVEDFERVARSLRLTAFLSGERGLRLHLIEGVRRG